jgi:hypothetical protein
VLGHFAGSGAFDALIRTIDVSVRSLQPLDSAHLEAALREAFVPAAEADVLLLPTAMRDILRGTVEAVIMSRLRMMRWQGLKLLGYSFYEGKTPVEIASVKDLAEQHSRIDSFITALGQTSLFSGELSWLKTLAAHQLHLMDVELDGTELESVPD